MVIEVWPHKALPKTGITDTDWMKNPTNFDNLNALIVKLDPAY